MLIKTPSDKSCMVRCIACEIDRLNVTRYSSSSTACCCFSALLPFEESNLRDFNWVTMESCTLVRHLERPAAWLHITDCSLNDLSHLLRVSWLKVLEAGAEGKLRLATLENILLSFAGSGDQSPTAWLDASFLTACMSYHLEVRGVLTNWSRSRPLVSVFLEG